MVLLVPTASSPRGYTVRGYKHLTGQCVLEISVVTMAFPAQTICRSLTTRSCSRRSAKDRHPSFVARSYSCPTPFHCCCIAVQPASSFLDLFDSTPLVLLDAVNSIGSTPVIESSRSKPNPIHGSAFLMPCLLHVSMTRWVILGPGWM